MRRTALRQINESSAQAPNPSYLAQHHSQRAHEHAMKLASALHRHLSCDTEQQPSQAYVLRLSDALGGIIDTALGVECELGTAREQYEFTWPAAGGHFDAVGMRSLNGPGDVVAVCLFPGLQMVKEGGTKTVFSGQVLLKAAPAV